MPDVIWSGTTELVEQADSPEWRAAENITAISKHCGPYALCLSSCPVKGTVGTGDYDGMLVAEARVTRDRTGKGTLLITYAGVPSSILTVTVPPDEMEINWKDEDFALEEHPRYSEFDADPAWDKRYRDAIRLAMHGNTEEERADAATVVFESALAQELLDKLERGQTHFFLPVPEYIWATHYASLPALTVGGYIENPTGPVTAPAGYDWLRNPDKISWTGTWWKVTRSWRAGFDIDVDIYPVE